MPDDIIVTEGLTKRFPPAITAVDGLDLGVHAGEIFGLLGPNGAGKSTTIGMLTTRVTPTSGRAAVGGVDIIARPAVAKQVIGVVPQTNTLDRAMTVFENLEFHGRYFGMSKSDARREAGEFLERVRLSDRASAPVVALSGGMAQRLMVARAIMHRPQVLFLDEPTAGLDPQSRLALWEILREFHREGQTILITTHHMEEADQLCDRVAIMDHGRILALDTPGGLKRSLGSTSVVRIAASGPLDALVAELRVTVPSARSSGISGGQMRMTVDDRTDVLPRVLAAAARVDVTITDLSIEETTLETVFINLTGKDLRE
jgi:ABC-2 type transport system ATP-binding protein